MSKKNKSKIKKKIHPYTKESLEKKEKQLKALLSLMEASILMLVMDVILDIVDISINKYILLVLLYLLTIGFFYLIKAKNKRYNFSKWEFLDDEVNILTDKRLDGEVKEFFINKFTIIIGINILIVIPLSLTFSTILASAISLVFAFFLEKVFVDLIKFLLIAIIFKNFFRPSNDILIRYLDK